MVVQRPQIQFDREKLKAMVHLICSECQPEELGFVKLHKSLYFADMLHHAWRGRPISGETYRKQQFGPIAQHLWDIVAELESEGKITVTEVPFYGYKKKEFRSVANPATNRLSEDQVTALKDVIEFVCRGNTARSISELSHTKAWERAAMGDVLPYHTVFHLFPVEVREEDLEWGREEARKVAAGR